MALEKLVHKEAIINDVLKKYDTKNFKYDVFIFLCFRKKNENCVNVTVSIFQAQLQKKKLFLPF